MARQAWVQIQGHCLASLSLSLLIHQMGSLAPPFDGFLEDEVVRDKKASILMEKMEGCADVTAVQKLAGAQSDTIRHITFNAPVFIPALGASEPALSGAAAKTAKGQFAKCIKGNMGVYAFQVIGENQPTTKLDDATRENLKGQIANQNLRAASSYMRELFQRANVSDRRYMFY